MNLSFLIAMSSMVAAFAGAPENTVPAAKVEPLLPLDVRTRSEAAVEKALAYLAAAQQSDGGWEAFGKPHIGVSALVVQSLIQSKDYGPQHPVCKRGVAFILKFAHPDGGIYDEVDGHKNYHTSVALMALAATKETEHRQAIRAAQDFLKELQWDSGEGYEASSPWYGGQGYGGGKRPDLSNTQLMVEALHQSGLPPDDPAYEKAMKFIARSQMLGKTNDQTFAEGSTDGGFVYSPVNGGESKAGTEVIDGKPRLRSYGSMTYAGFKSMLYAKLDRNDERVRQAVEWIRRHYTLEHNPNMPGEKSREGLYYYYYIFSRAMKAWGEETIQDERGTGHPWRTELCNMLLSLQRENGSWVNESDRWFEGNPHLVTAYSVLALQTALEKP